MRLIFIARTKKAASLLEVMLASAIMAGIFISVWLIMDRGVRFYRLTSDAQSRQREALNFVTRLSTQLLNSRPALVYLSSTPATSAGISYATPEKADGAIAFETSGARRLLWSAYGCYYINSQRDLRWFRQEIATPTATPQTPFAAGVRPEDMAANSNGVLLVRNVTLLEVIKRPIGTTINTPLGPRPSENEFFDIRLELGKRDDPLGYWLQIRSSFYPRN
jgi:hypothetical protein